MSVPKSEDGVVKHVRKCAAGQVGQVNMKGRGYAIKKTVGSLVE